MVWARQPDPDGQIRLEPEALRMVALLPDYLLRVVASRNALIEKVHAFEAELDDRVIEMLKHELVANHGGMARGGRDRFWFVGQAEARDSEVPAVDLVFVDTDSRDKSTMHLTHVNHYAPIAAELGDILRRTGGRSDGWCRVDQAYVQQAIGGHERRSDRLGRRPPARRATPVDRQEILGRVGTLLRDFIAIHDDVLRPSFRRVIPIPGVFKRVDYGAHAEVLSNVSDGLSDIGSELRAGAGRVAGAGWSAIRSYCVALHDAVSRLGGICKRLEMKALGRGTYAAAEYKSDLAEYLSAVDRYRQLGRSMNELS